MKDSEFYMNTSVQTDREKNIVLDHLLQISDDIHWDITHLMAGDRDKRVNISTIKMTDRYTGSEVNKYLWYISIANFTSK